MSIVVVGETELGIVELAAPLEGLCDVSVGGHFTIGGIGVGGGEVAVGGEELADVLCEIPAVGVPRAIFLDGEGAGGDRLGWIPEDVPEGGCAFGCQVTGGNLEVASVEVALVQRGFSVGFYLLSGAAAFVVVGATDARCYIPFRSSEGDGAVLRVVLHTPDTCAGFD